MVLQFDIWAVFLIIGVFQGLFITPLLLRKKTTAGRWLTLLVHTLTLLLLNELALNVRFYRIWPHFLGFSFPLMYLIGPIYFFYIKSLLFKQFKTRWVHLLHLIPFLLMVVYQLPFYATSRIEKINRLDASLSATEYDVSISFIIPIALHVVQTLFYLILANRELRKVNSTANEQNLKFKKWLQGFTLVFGVYWFMNFLWMLYLTLANSFFKEVDYINVLMNAVVVNLLAYMAVYHNREFSQYLLALFSEKYKKSSLSSQQSKGLLRRVISLMETEKLYLDPEFKISEIANRLSTSTNIISQVLNQETNKNFYEFVNEYRIAEAMKRLSDPKFSHITILGVAMDSGFSNKNTFNRLFKKHTGLTPTQFIRNMA